MGFNDPCGNEQGFEFVLGCYAKYVALGDNWKNMTEVRSKTTRGYLEAVETLFKLRGYKSPIVWDDDQNLAAMVVKNLEKQEEIANQRSSLTNEIFAELIRRGNEAEKGSEEWLVMMVAKLGKVIGPRISEYGQKTQSKVDVHEYPSGKKVVKAFTREDFEFFDTSGKRIRTFNSKTRARVGKVRIRWRIQKNRRNGEKLMFKRENDDEICPVLAAFDIFMHSLDIGQPENLPMAATLDKKGKLKYLTNSKVTAILRKAAKAAHPDWTEEEINKISAHSLRVWACVLLSEAGAEASFIQSRLRWLGDSYRLYLRDTNAINDRHRDALAKASAAVMKLIGNNLDESLLPDIVPEDTDMGDEYDEMD